MFFVRHEIGKDDPNGRFGQVPTDYVRFSGACQQARQHPIDDSVVILSGMVAAGDLEQCKQKPLLRSFCPLTLDSDGTPEEFFGENDAQNSHWNVGLDL